MKINETLQFGVNVNSKHVCDNISLKVFSLRKKTYLRNRHEGSKIFPLTL